MSTNNSIHKPEINNSDWLVASSYIMVAAQESQQSGVAILTCREKCCIAAWSLHQKSYYIATCYIRPNCRTATSYFCTIPAPDCRISGVSYFDLCRSTIPAPPNRNGRKDGKKPNSIKQTWKTSPGPSTTTW